MKINFTENQNEFINCPDKNIFLNACPGAGKTKAVVARYIKRAEELSRNFGRRSIAVLSFTNVAINEISDRCLKNNLPFLIHYPNYVGTFDSFLNRYFFRQLVNHPLKQPISVVESWDTVGAAVSCEYGSIPLSNFLFSGNSISLRKTNDFSVNVPYRKNPERWNYLAEKLRQQYFSFGIISAEEVRNFIFPRIEKDDKIFNSLSKRFEEIIIDEIQDCNEQDLFILEKARDYGCNIVMVGDLDQSIYRFRNVNLSKIEAFVSSHKPIKLTDNFRSTKIICELYSTLRHNNSIDNSGAEHADLNIPIGLIFYKTLNKDIADRFTSLLGELDASIRDYKIIS
ncbi:MAG: UvrD-helicase domain-containing protein, partial [Melioribacteraceae bacterium]|nr:UvrD-helicase domain-containing protein [Melioribacteraceae bacterium]